MNIIQYVFGLFVVCFSIGCVSVDNPNPLDGDVVTEAEEASRDFPLYKKVTLKKFSEEAPLYIGRSCYVLDSDHIKFTDDDDSSRSITDIYVPYGRDLGNPKYVHFITDKLVCGGVTDNRIYAVSFQILVDDNGVVSGNTSSNLHASFTDKPPGYDHNRDFANLKRSDLTYCSSSVRNCIPPILPSGYPNAFIVTNGFPKQD